MELEDVKDGDALLLSETPEEIRESRIEYIRERWKQLSDTQGTRTEAFVKHLTLSNAGGALAVLSFLGAAYDRAMEVSAPLMLAFFVAGLLLVGVLHLAQLGKVAGLFEGWRNDVGLFYSDRLTWGELLGRDRQRLSPPSHVLVLGGASFICFVVGGALGLWGVLSLTK